MEIAEYVAYLNGQFVGYGYLEEVIRVVEVRSLASYTVDMMEAGRQVMGEIDAIHWMHPFVRQLANNSSQEIRFSGKMFSQGQIQDVKDIPVVILAAQSQMPFLDCSPILGFSNRIQPHRLTLTVRADPNYQTQSLCPRCPYFIPHPFNTCNAFHPEVNVSECADFQEL